MPVDIEQQYKRRPADNMAEDGIALCLSGGGYRAALFHLGAIRRLNELGVLSKVATITSVSGGSILNAFLAMRWANLEANQQCVFSNFDSEIASRVRRICSHDIRTPLLIGARFKPENWPAILRAFGTIPAELLSKAYAPFFENILLADIPCPSTRVPRFVFCATNENTGASWQFHCGANARMGDFYTGYWDVGKLLVADAVAASSAFPAAFSGLRLNVRKNTNHSRMDPWGILREVAPKRMSIGDPPFGEVILTDGGVYDNLGVEPIWNRFSKIIVSDAGRPIRSLRYSPQLNILRLKRSIDISVEQVGAVRKRWLHEQLTNGSRLGALWSINTKIEMFGLDDSCGYGDPIRNRFPEIRTDLNAFTLGEMSCLENHGYSLCDTALRSKLLNHCTNPTCEFIWPNKQYITNKSVSEALRKSELRTIIRDVINYFKKVF